MPSPLVMRKKLESSVRRFSHKYEDWNQCKNGMGIDCSSLQCPGARGRRFIRSGRYEIKVVLLGKAYGGKTCLFNRFLADKFNGDHRPYQATIGAAFGSKTLREDDKQVTLSVWDTGGCERFEAVSRLYYRGAQAAILCYDLTDTNSFDRVKFWVSELTEQEPDCYIYLCGTKSDLLREPYCLERQVKIKDLIKYAENAVAVGTYETSSKTGEGVDDLFHAVAKDFLQAVEEMEDSDSDKSSQSNGSASALSSSNNHCTRSNRVILHHTESGSMDHHSKCQQGCG